MFLLTPYDAALGDAVDEQPKHVHGLIQVDVVGGHRHLPVVPPSHKKKAPCGGASRVGREPAMTSPLAVHLCHMKWARGKRGPPRVGDDVRRMAVVRRVTLCTRQSSPRQSLFPPGVMASYFSPNS